MGGRGVLNIYDGVNLKLYMLCSAKTCWRCTDTDGWSGFLVGLFEPHDGESFSANIPVLINCFRGVTCTLPMAVGLF